MSELTAGGVVVVPLIVGLVQVAKQAGLSPAWGAPLAVGLGLALRLGYQLAADTSGAAAWLDALVQGLALGLAASGLYSGVKRTAAGAPTEGGQRASGGSEARSA